jgi:hypothetical protein
MTQLLRENSSAKARAKAGVHGMGKALAGAHPERGSAGQARPSLVERGDGPTVTACSHVHVCPETDHFRAHRHSQAEPSRDAGRAVPLTCRYTFSILPDFNPVLD